MLLVGFYYKNIRVLFCVCVCGSHDSINAFVTAVAKSLVKVKVTL